MHNREHQGTVLDRGRPASAPWLRAGHPPTVVLLPSCPHNPTHAHARAPPEPPAGSPSTSPPARLGAADREAQRRFPGPLARPGWTGGGGFPPPGGYGTRGARGVPGRQKAPAFQEVPRNSEAAVGHLASGGWKKPKGSIPDPFSFNRLETPTREFSGVQGLAGKPLRNLSEIPEKRLHLC